MVSAKKSFLDWLKAGYAVIAAWCFKYLGGLVLEEKDGKMVISIGRTMLLLVFLIMVYFWLVKKVQEGSSLELPDGLYATFVSLCGYVAGSKVVGVFKTRNKP